jgi:hypothetical protein
MLPLAPSRQSPAACVDIIELCGTQLIESIQVPEDNGNDLQALLIEKILAHMRAHPASADVQSSACFELLFPALAEPAAGLQSPRCDDLMIHAGCIECISTALELHESNTEVLLAAIKLLEVLARRKENGMQIARHGCIKLVLDVMHDLDDEAGIQEVGCKMLRSITGGLGAGAMDLDDNRIEIHQLISVEGGIELILSAMRAFSANKLVQLYGCGVLKNLAREHEYIVDIVEEGGIAAVVHALEVHSPYIENTRVVVECFALLRIIALDGDFNRDIYENGGLWAVVMSMWLHTSNEVVQQHGCMIIITVAGNAVLGSYSLQSALRNVLVSARTRYPNNTIIQLCVEDFALVHLAPRDDGMLDESG